MVKKVIAFDLDDTLAVSKSPISDRMAGILARLLEKYDVCVISGGKYEQFQTQVISHLASEISPRLMTKLHIMPTCGTRYYRFSELSNEWEPLYENNLTAEEKDRIREALEDGAKKLGLWEENPYGEIIEDRGSQVTFSALGQQAPAEAKYAWDPTGEKKIALRNFVADKLPDLEVRAGGTTSIDVTMIGIDKAYGMNKLMEEMKICKEEILYVGDKIQEGGNDYPVKAMGIDCIEVNRWEDTAYLLEGILAVS